MTLVYDHDNIQIFKGDCLEIMPTLEAQSFDAVICDPPYQQTSLSWDVIIPFDDMWRNIKRLLKSRGACVLFGSEPFSSLLRVSNLDWYKYDWVWDKSISGNPLLAEYQPLKIHENISVFSNGAHVYNPEMRKGKMRKKGGGYSKLFDVKLTSSVNDDYFPVSIIEYSNAVRKFHNTEKPLELMQYLIRTYTNPGDRILDFTAGSGTTLHAAKIERRACVGIERDTDADGNGLGYVNYAIQRLSQEVMF